MSTGIVLLSVNNVYVGQNGKLPPRPDWDKTFLLAMCKGKTVLCSPNTLKSLPESVLTTAWSLTTNPHHSWDINLGIATFRDRDGWPDTMYVCKTDKYFEGKVFRMDWLEKNYRLVCDSPELKIYWRN